MKFLLKLEDAALFIGALVLFIAIKDWAEISWWVFAVAALAPDLSMLAYLAGPKIGAMAYNVVHTWFAPIALAGLSWLVGWPFGIGLALIWGAHIAIDRALGYGLKYPSGFKDTHLGRIGGEKAAN